MTSDTQIKHLEFIQGAINRQATNSFTIKGWSITISSALYAYTATHLSWWMAVVAIMPAVGFAFLDVYYLRLERQFRELFKDVARGAEGTEQFNMSLRPYEDDGKYPYCKRREVWKSPSVWLLYGATWLVGVFLFWVAILKGDRAAELAKCISNAF